MFEATELRSTLLSTLLVSLWLSAPLNQTVECALECLIVMLRLGFRVLSGDLVLRLLVWKCVAHTETIASVGGDGGSHKDDAAVDQAKLKGHAFQGCLYRRET